MCECGHKVEVMIESRALGHENLVDVRTVIGVMQAIFDRDAKPFEEGSASATEVLTGATSFSGVSSAPST
jgi:hypothetical protein